MVDFTSGYSSRKRVALRGEAPAKVSGITGYRGCPRTEVSPTSSRCACEIATAGSNTLACASRRQQRHPVRVSQRPFTCYVATITAAGDGFAARVNGSGN